MCRNFGGKHTSRDEDLLGWRALHLAACFGHKDVVQRLLAAKAQASGKDLGLSFWRVAVSFCWGKGG